MKRKLIAITILCGGIVFLTFAMTSDSAANRDFISYWAAGVELIHNADPYEPQAILALERSAGYQGERPLLMRNPPFAMFLTLPLGLLRPKTGAILWSLAIIACLAVSIRILWTLHGRPKGRLHLAGYFFPPALACLLAGQTGAFLLLGLVLFLAMERKSPTAAGLALLLCALKPHLFLPFAVSLTLWMISVRPWRMLLGLIAGCVSASVVATLFRPAIWSDYVALLHTAGIESEFIPTFSAVLRVAVDRNAAWLQFVPVALGCIWAAWYFLRHRLVWDWRREGSLVILVSLWLAPYAWFTDETALLPPILAALYTLDRTRRPIWPVAIPAAVALVEVLSHVPLTSGLYIWTSTAWLAAYVYVSNTTRREDFLPRKSE